MALTYEQLEREYSDLVEREDERSIAFLFSGPKEAKMKVYLSLRQLRALSNEQNRIRALGNEHERLSKDPLYSFLAQKFNSDFLGNLRQMTENALLSKYHDRKITKAEYKSLSLQAD